MKLEIRCCCIPKKLLGWIKVNEDHVREGQRLRFAVANRPIRRSIDVDPSDIVSDVTMHVRWIKVPGRMPYLALKAEGIPIETVRKIVRFEENVS